MTPQSAQPRNAATHSAQFGLHSRTASPFAIVARLELAGELIRHFGYTLVAPTLAPVASRKHVGAGVIAISAPALEIVQRIQQTCPHTLFSSTIPRTLQD